MSPNAARIITFSCLLSLSSLSVAADNPAAMTSKAPARYSLSQAVEFALSNNPNLQMMHERIHQAEAQIGLAKSLFYPQVNARMAYEYSDNPMRAFGMIISQRRLNFSGTDFNHPGGISNYRPEVAASMSLYNGGQDLAHQKAAELGLQSAALQESATRNLLIEMVTSAYYAILAAQEARHVAKSAITAVESELKQTQIQYDAGNVLKSDVLSLQTKLAEAKDAELQAANAIDLAKAGLNTLLGAEASTTIELSTIAGERIPVLKDSARVLTDQAIAQRPELQAAKLKIAIAQQQLEAARGAYLPKANAFVSYGSDSPNLAYSTGRDNVTAGVALEVNVFAGFAHKESISKAQSEVNEAKLALEELQNQIEQQVQVAYLQLTNALARLEVTHSAVTQAEEALRLVNAQRQAGIETVTRYIEAEAARDQAHSRVIAARYDALQAEARLNQAVGSWK